MDRNWWELSVLDKTVVGKFSQYEEIKWDRACAVLKEIAWSKGLRAATSPSEEDHGYGIRTVCRRCQNEKCSRVLLVWEPGQYEGIHGPIDKRGVEVPLELNGAQDVCSNWFLNPSPPVFSVRGYVDPNSATYSFCQAVEAVVAILFHGKFEIGWEPEEEEFVQYKLYDDEKNNALLVNKTSEEFAKRICATKHVFPSLSELSFREGARGKDRDRAVQIYNNGTLE